MTHSRYGKNNIPVFIKFAGAAGISLGLGFGAIMTSFLVSSITDAYKNSIEDKVHSEAYSKVESKYQDKIEQLEKDLLSEKQEYSELEAKVQRIKHAKLQIIGDKNNDGKPDMVLTYEDGNLEYFLSNNDGILVHATYLKQQKIQELEKEFEPYLTK